MDKINWLKNITDTQPSDAESWYWLGMEYASQGDLLKAIRAFSEGLRYADEQLQLQLLAELSKAMTSLQKGKHDEQEEQEEHGESRISKSKTTSYPGLQVIEGGKSEFTPNDASEVTFADVAGLIELKKTIHMRIISPFQNQGLFAKFRKKAGGGILLYGPPGCGKTFIAKATAGECQAKFVTVHITDILDPYIGVSEQNLKELFDKARNQKPSIMFFDEIDAIGFSRSKSSSHMRLLVNTFLSEIEGIDTSTDKVLIIGATNMPWDVDSALKRPGRFDRMIFVAPPDNDARTRIFELKLQGRYIGSMDYARLAKNSEMFSGADIENVCELAAERVLEEIIKTGVERPINMKDMEETMSATQPSTLEWLRTAKNYVKYSNQSGLYNDVEDYLKRYGKRI